MTDSIPNITHKILKNSCETIADMENEITACNMKLAKCLAFIKSCVLCGDSAAEEFLKEIGES